ncbi:MAG: hypothetical protein J3R72DRAFT_76660 [Linnemannia gamsii]|nr:MAG: hypothetical protein J3R72DRAFT_76660 [Linnemannia gamsii]
MRHQYARKRQQAATISKDLTFPQRLKPGRFLFILSAKADRDNEIMKVEEAEVYSPQPHVPTETEASDKFDNENEGDTNAQDSLEKRERERRRILFPHSTKYIERMGKVTTETNLDKPGHSSEHGRAIRQTLPEESQIFPPEPNQFQDFPSKTQPLPSNIFKEKTEYQALVEKINWVHSHGLKHNMSIPQMAIIGDHSSGKSSVLEALTSLSFPRDKGMITRFEILVNYQHNPILPEGCLPNRNTHQ